MLAVLDVDYRDEAARAAGVLFDDWGDETPSREIVRQIEQVEPYVSGQFYKRELPCLLAVLREIDGSLEAVIIDGYVWLQDEQTPGLGGHLYEALGRKVPVIGVAKTRFASATLAREVRRGDSEKPLHVTAAGMDVEEAARLVKMMHGPYRLPTMLKRVDQLCRNS
jgi:deoxyribonuclease V